MQDVHFKLNPMFVMVKATLNTKNALFTTSKLDLILWTKLVKYYIWSTALCGAETWTFWKVDQFLLLAIPKCF